MKTLEERAEDAAVWALFGAFLALGALLCWLWFRPWAVAVLGLGMFAWFMGKSFWLSHRAGD